MTKTSARIWKISLIVLIVLFLAVGTYCTLTYFLKGDSNPQRVTMYLDVNGGDFEQAPRGYLRDSNGNYKTMIDIGGKYGVLPTPTKYGNEFLGWIADSVSEKFVKPNDDIDFVGNFTLVAQWRQQAVYDYAVNYYDEYGEKIKPSTSGMAMNETMFTVEIPNIAGYTFNDSLSEQTKKIGVETVFDLYYLPNTYFISYAINNDIVFEQI